MLNSIIKKMLRDFIEKFVSQDLILRVINKMFDLLRAGAGRIPGTWDDEALAAFEASINKQEIAAKTVEWLLELIMPSLQQPAQATNFAITAPATEFDAEAAKVTAEVVARITP